MRKSSFGHRPPRGKPHRGGGGGAAGPSGRDGGRDRKGGDRSAAPSGLREGMRVRKPGGFGGKKPFGKAFGSRRDDAFEGRGEDRRGGGERNPRSRPRNDRRDERRDDRRDDRRDERRPDRDGPSHGKRFGRDDGERRGFKLGARGKDGPRAHDRDRERGRDGPRGSEKDRRNDGGRDRDRGPRRGDAPSKGSPFKVRKRPGGGPARPGHQRPGQPKIAAVSEPMRIAKAMARAGLCSRREAERWIAEGRVSLNGRVLRTPAVEVKPRDRVLVDGVPMPVAEPAQLWRYNKPKGLVTTHNDPQGRPTVFDNLPPGLPRVISVGRLDFNTEGLILLTNDGELARHLELPATGWLRRYRVRCKGRVTEADLEKLKEGVEVEGVRYGPVEATIDSVQAANMWLTVGIREGKNREVRKVLASLGLEVNRLIRISFGPFQLLTLKPGEAEVVRRRVLADQLGPDRAAEFGLVDKDAKKPGGKPQQQAPSRNQNRDGGEDD